MYGPTLTRFFILASFVFSAVGNNPLHASDLRDLFYQLLLSSNPRITIHSHIQGPLEKGDIELPEGFIALLGGLKQQSVSEPVFNLGTPEFVVEEPDGSIRRWVRGRKFGSPSPCFVNLSTVSINDPNAH